METVAELVDNLFRTHRKPNGREYTYAEIAEALNGAIDPSHLSRLRSGQIKNPGRETLLALCRFFKVRPTYFFPELEGPETGNPENEPLAIALRSTHMKPSVKRKLQELIDALEDDEEDQEEGHDHSAR